MRVFAAVVLFSATTLALAQQQQLDEDTLARIRVENAVSGLGEIKPQEKEMANVGAGPHTVRHTEAAKREPVAEEPQEQAAQGGTAPGGTAPGGAESKDANVAPHRP